MGRRVAALVLLMAVVVTPASAGESVDLELVLLVDASRSIDDGELRFQREGYAVAITHPEVLGAISHGFLRRIAVVFVEWADETSQEVVVPWTVIDGEDSARRFAKAMLAVAFMLVLYRLVRGPDLADRVLALDTLYINTVALLLVYGIELRSNLYYEAALLIALLGFIGTVAMAKFMQRGDIIE